MTAAPSGASKAAAENEDAVKNSTNTNKRVRRSTAKSVNEGEVLPKAQPEDVSKPGDEARPAEDDNATPTGVERPENDPAKHPASEDPFADDEDDTDEPEPKAPSQKRADPDTVPEPVKTSTDSPLGLDPDEDDKADKMKDRNIADLEQGDMPSSEELPVRVPGPNDPVPEGQIEVTRNAEKGEPSDPGGRVSENRKAGKQRAPKSDPLKDLTDLTKLPVAVAYGQVTGSVDEYAGQAVLSLSLRGWVGEAPMKILAKDVGDLEQVIAELRNQL